MYEELINALRIHADTVNPECSKCAYLDDCMEDGSGEYKMVETAAAAIEELQAEVKRLEPKRGEWYKPYGFTQKSYKRVCTNCQDVAYFCGKGNYLYCPNCGAKMGGTDASRPD